MLVDDHCGGIRVAYQVVTEQLHDEGGVLVALLAEGVELCGDRQCFGVCESEDRTTYRQ